MNIFFYNLYRNNFYYQFIDWNKKKLNYNKNLPIYILIGPEGDFSVKELDLLKELGVKLFSLGNRKLRAETAAQTTLSILNEFLD